MQHNHTAPFNIVLCAVLLMIAAIQPVTAQQAQEGNVSPLFQSHEPLTLTINAPFRTIQRYRGDNRPYQAATMIINDSNGQPVQLDLEIRVRGKFRAKRSTCNNPPLRLNFKRKSLVNTVFDGEDKLKLVVQCRNSDDYLQYLMQEYMIYRVYQLFTEDSLRVRLAMITYYDSERDREMETSPAFFIEDVDRMGQRTGLKEVKVEKLRRDDYDRAQVNLVDVFQYFIGNTDWSAYQGPPGEGCCHNIIPFSGRGRTLIPVPYDFDLNGVVNPSYAEVNDALPIKNVRQRLYRGICQPDDVLRATLDAFRTKRNEIRALYENQVWLSERSRNYALNYYDRFYETINDNRKLNKEIIEDCR